MEQDERIEFSDWKDEWYKPLTKEERNQLLLHVEDWALATRGRLTAARGSEQRYVVDVARRAKSDGGPGWEIIHHLMLGNLELDRVDEHGLAFRMGPALVRDERSRARDRDTFGRILDARYPATDPA